jgi:hypothetical protein
MLPIHIQEENMNRDNEKELSKKRNLRLVEKYDNDDYSRFAGPDYSDEPFELGEEDFEHSAHTQKKEINLRPEGNWHHPGVSGKTEDGDNWVNRKEYKEQTNFTGYGPKNYKRSDDRIYEEVCSKLMRNRDIDASNIGVKVESGVVFLSGKVEGRKVKKLAELIIEDLPGVQDVRNELTVIKGDTESGGPAGPTKKDLGIN